MEAGRRIGKYVLDERIAVGGMAEVWAAHVEGREGFVKPVALKFMLESFSGDPELERLFVDEARIAARLQHANLVAVFDFDKVADDERGLAGRYYIAMERVEGLDLRRLADGARRAGYALPVGLTLYVAGEVLKALRYVHEKRDAKGRLGLVHRDVSPHNVLVGQAGEVKLSDFGIAKAREHSTRNTKPGGMRGKIAYAAPEQLAGGLVDHRTDQFAAGITIWELLAGRRLFDGDSDLEIIGKVARCEIPSLGAGGRADVPAAVEAVLRRMLAADPAARFATTGEALSAVLGLPGYSPDGAPLGELVRALSGASSAGLSHTLPVGLLVGAGAATRTMDGGAPLRPPSTDMPTRVAKRTTEALARSPAAAERSATVDVRVGNRRARLTGAAIALALAAIAVALARRDARPDRGSSPSAEVRATPAAEAPPPAPVEAPRPAPVEAVRPAPVEAARPAEVAAAPVGAPPAAAASATAAPPAVPERARTSRSARAGEGDHRHAAKSNGAATADAPVTARPTGAPSPPSSAHGAPIIE